MYELLIYDRSAIANGEAWRLLSGHFVHLSFTHLLLNGVGLFLFFIIFRRYSSWRTSVGVMGVLGVMVSLSLYIGSPMVAQYGGFSGILYGLFGWLSVRMIQSQDRVIGVMVLLLLGLKIGMEQQYGSFVHYESFMVITDAHLYGYGWGVMVGILELYYRKTPRVNRVE